MSIQSAEGKTPVDYSTIRQSVLEKLKPYDVGPGYTLGDSMGNGCIMDPPGYPSYFTRNIWTGGGDSPSKEPNLVLALPGQPLRVVTRGDDWKPGDTWDTVKKRQDDLLRRLWNPEAVSEERMMAWVLACYQYFGNGWIDPTSGSRNVSDLIFGSVQRPNRLTSKGFELREFKDDPRFSDEWRRSEQEAIRLHNEETLTRWRQITADLGNYRPIDYIRQWFPDHTPMVDWIETPPKDRGNWWEILATKPTPETCPGEVAWSTRTGKKTHPIAKTWCQVCDWREPKEEVPSAS